MLNALRLSIPEGDGKNSNPMLSEKVNGIREENLSFRLYIPFRPFSICSSLPAPTDELYLS